MRHFFTNANVLFLFTKLENHQHKNFLSTAAVSIVDSDAVCMENNFLKKSFCNYIQNCLMFSKHFNVCKYINNLCRRVWLRAKQSLACQQL